MYGCPSLPLQVQSEDIHCTPMAMEGDRHAINWSSINWSSDETVKKMQGTVVSHIKGVWLQLCTCLPFSCDDIGDLQLTRTSLETIRGYFQVHPLFPFDTLYMPIELLSPET